MSGLRGPAKAIIYYSISHAENSGTGKHGSNLVGVRVYVCVCVSVRVCVFG